jgi:hypothetical protein
VVHHPRFIRRFALCAYQPREEGYLFLKTPKGNLYSFTGFILVVISMAGFGARPFIQFVTLLSFLIYFFYDYAFCSEIEIFRERNDFKIVYRKRFLFQNRIREQAGGIKADLTPESENKNIFFLISGILENCST